MINQECGQPKRREPRKLLKRDSRRYVIFQRFDPPLVRHPYLEHRKHNFVISEVPGCRRADDSHDEEGDGCQSSECDLFQEHGVHGVLGIATIATNWVLRGNCTSVEAVYI